VHDIKLFVEKTTDVKNNLSRRGYDLKDVDLVIELNETRKSLTQKVENDRAQIKKLSEQIGAIKKQGADATALMDQVANIKKGSAENELRLEENKKSLNDLLSRIPNLIDESVPEGKDETGNKEIKSWGTKPDFKFKAKEHFELGEDLGMLDFEAAAKLTGARFCVYKKQIARMERALINFMIDQHVDAGYEEILPPFIVNADTLYGTGQLPKFKDDLFRLDLPDRDWYLIPTAEVPITNLKKNELFNKNELPLKYTAYTPCFRSEAGSYGRDTKGLIRQHQFNKVELVNIVSADVSDKAHKDMIDRACSILELLKLPYRAMLLCAGDMGFGSRKTIDLEVWLPGQNTYREISSISNCWDFQARRAGIRFRGVDGKPEFAHTLNGSGLAVGRTLVAIMENYQQENGTIVIPEALRPYMGGAQLIQK